MTYDEAKSLINNNQNKYSNKHVQYDGEKWFCVTLILKPIHENIYTVKASLQKGIGKEIEVPFDEETIKIV